MSTKLTEKVRESAQYVVIPKNTVDNKEEIVWECLEALGIYDDDISYEILMSSDCKEGDARAVFCDTAKIPVPRFRKIWGILKEGAEKEDKLSTSSYDLRDLDKYMKPIGQFSNKDLLVRYSENPEDSACEEELRKRSCGNRCIVYNPDNKTVNVELSAKLLAKAKRGIQVPTVLKDEGSIYKVYEVGGSPEESYEICPISGEVLFEGYSSDLGVYWELPLEAKQFVWLMEDQGIKVDAYVVNNLQEKFKADEAKRAGSGMDNLRLQYPKVSELYDELKDLGELPSLKKKANTRSSQVSDPFKRNKRY